MVVHGFVFLLFWSSSHSCIRTFFGYWHKFFSLFDSIKQLGGDLWSGISNFQRITGFTHAVILSKGIDISIYLYEYICINVCTICLSEDVKVPKWSYFRQTYSLILFCESSIFMIGGEGKAVNLKYSRVM